MAETGQRGYFGKTATSDELHPIRYPRSDSDHQSQSTIAANHNNGSRSFLPQYNTMQENSVPLSRLRSGDGGYLGPAATDGVNPTFLHSQQGRNNIRGHLNNNNDPSSGERDKERGNRPMGSVEGDSASFQSERQREINSCQTRTGCEKILLMMGSTLLMIIIALAAGLVVLQNQGYLFGGSGHTCDTRECVRAAGVILESLDESVDPCENFVQFACGGWYSAHPVPEATFRWSVLDDLDEITLYEVRDILEDEPKINESIPVIAARKVYHACMNDTQWSEVGLAPLIALMVEAGGLPMTTPDWSPEGFQLEETLAWIRRAGGQSLVALTVSPDVVNNSHYAINLMQGLLPLSIGKLKNASDHLKSNHISFIKNAAKKILEAEGFSENETLLDSVREDAEAVWNFTVELAEISEERTSPWDAYNPMTINELTHITNHKDANFEFNWLSYIEKTFKDVNITFNGNRRVIVHQPDYFGNLTTLLGRTEKRTVANFLMYQVIRAMAEETSSSLRDIHRSFDSPLWNFGRVSTRPWHDCAGKTRVLLPMAVAQLYFKTNPIEDVTDAAKTLVLDVQDAFRTMLEDATWMSSETRNSALRKLDEMILLVANPPYLFDDDALNKHMKGLPEVSTDDHFGNMMALSKWYGHRSLAKILSSPKRDRWPTGTLEINAYYSSTQNSIVIPGGILQPQFFHHGDMAALNYGGVGAIVGHEITHGFDTNGRKFDWRGRLAEWWDKHTMDLYVNRSKCFENQYSSYNVSDLLHPYESVDEDLKINGEKSKGENVADNGGVRAAWLAYKKQIQKTGEDLSLPGLENYNQDQLFFITFSRLWCMQFTPWSLQYTLANDIHPPGHYRILGSLQNTQEFSDAFSCPKGSYMNPEKKCRLW